MVCKLAEVPPEMCINLLIEAKKWLLNKINCQQHENDKLKTLSSGKNNGNVSEKMKSIPPICKVNM
jgi:hypothetical protein